MSAVRVEPADIRLSVPVFRLGRVRGAVVVQVVARTRGRDRAASSVAAGIERAEAHRTRAMAHRLPGF